VIYHIIVINVIIIIIIIIITINKQLAGMAFSETVVFVVWLEGFSDFCYAYRSC